MPVTWKKFQETQKLSLYALDIATPAFPRDGHASCILESKIFVFGGLTPQGYSNELLVLETQVSGNDKLKWTEIEKRGDIPEPRAYCDMCAVGTDIYLFGGMVARHEDDGNGSEFVNDLHILHTNKNLFVWERVMQTNSSPRNRCPSPRCGFSMVGKGRLLILFGGMAVDPDHSISRIFLQDLWFLDTTTRLWLDATEDVKGNAPSARRNHAMVVLGDSIWLFGGRQPEGVSDGSNAGYLRDLFVLDLKRLYWTRVESSGEHPPHCSGMRLCAWRLASESSPTTFLPYMDTLLGTHANGKALNTKSQSHSQSATPDELLLLHGGLFQEVDCTQEDAFNTMFRHVFTTLSKGLYLRLDV
jgi:hypothetical protein